MSISSNSLFHFTQKVENIIGILEKGFELHFCDEYIRFGKIMKRKKRKDFYIYDSYPMVSFCDAPLSQTKELMKSYGYYGLGMSKKWGQKKGVSPVLYLQEDSLPARVIGQLIYDGPRTVSDELESFDHAFYMSSFIKNYRGIAKAGKVSDKISYNEREWRYIPELSYNDDSAEKCLPLKFGKKHIKKAEENLKVYALKFKLKHIKYIIAKDTKNAGILIDYFNEKYDKREISDSLISRIITTNQILEDF